MYGYIKPDKPEMKIKEYEVYRGFYCSLCGVLGKRYGFPARLLLSYDLTCFLIFCLAVNNKKCSFTECRCPVNRAKKCMRACGNDAIFNYCADVTVILAYYKLKDTIADSGIIKKTAAYILLPYLSYLMRKAKKYNPETEKKAALFFAKQFRTENRPIADIDYAAEPTAEFTAMLASDICDENKDEVYSFGFMLGRYIYLQDAFDDIEKDIKSNSFNPFVNCYNITINNIKEKAEKCSQTIELTISEIIDRYKRNNIEQYGEILGNIIELGLYKQLDIIKNKYNTLPQKNRNLLPVFCVSNRKTQG